jgi:hypothetical protein
MTFVRDRGATAVADRDLDRRAVQRPRDLKPFAGQRVSMQDRVAQQLANDEGRVGYGSLEDTYRL